MTRLRDLGIVLGDHRTGPANAINDVVGVNVGHRTVIRDEPNVVRTGVTVVNTLPPEQRGKSCFGGLFSFNGNGELTGSHWLEESGLLFGPLAITNTHQVGLVRDTLVAETLGGEFGTAWCLPVVGETYDGFLNDIASFPLTADDVREALADADRDGPVAEGNVGGGTGMICHGFKGGIGNSSRIVDSPHGSFTIGVLVQANYGSRGLLRLDGHPIGAAISDAEVPPPSDPATAGAGSIIVVIATDAPLLADQCKRLARRATVGVARVGGTGSNGSGDLFLAFSTYNRLSPDGRGRHSVETLGAEEMSPLFDAAAEAVEESIWNALCAAQTMVGHQGTVHAIPHDRIRDVPRG